MKLKTLLSTALAASLVAGAAMGPVEACRRQPFHGAREGRGGQCEIEGPPWRKPVLGLERGDALRQCPVGVIGTIPEGLIVHAARAKRLGLVLVNARVLKGPSHERVVGLLSVVGASCHPKNPSRRRNGSIRHQVRQSGQELAAREVTGPSKDHKRTGRRSVFWLHGNGQRLSSGSVQRQGSALGCRIEAV